MPTFQLIDEPLIFALLGCFVTALLGLYDGCNRRLIAIYLGLGLAGAYLLKIAAVAFVPAAFIFLLAFVWKDQKQDPRGNSAIIRRLFEYGLAIFAPLLIANLSWEYFKIGTSCTASPIQLLTSGTGPAAHQPLAVAIGFIEATADFLLTYKLPLTILSAASFACGLFYGRARWLIVAFCGFISVYCVALYFGYVSCFDVFEMGKFEALPRYLRTPVRLAHFLGLIILLMSILKFGVTRDLARKWLASRRVQTVLATAIVLLLGWQVRSVDRSLDDMRTRNYQDPVLRTMIVNIKEQAASLIAQIERRHLVRPSVSLIAQNGYSAEFDLAMYFGIKSRPDGGSNFEYVPQYPFFWAPERENIFTDVTSPEKLAIFWKGFDIIWPYRTDGFIREALHTLVSDPACAENPENYFLFRTSDDTFACVAKAQ